MYFYFSLASGSTGNCGLFHAGNQNILIDAGISLRAIKTGLSKINYRIDNIHAILLTHSHADHIKALPMLLKHTDINIYASAICIKELSTLFPESCGKLHPFETDTCFSLGEIEVSSFSTPHDAQGSVGFVLTYQHKRFGYATDLGFVPSTILAHLQGCEFVVLESNYDPYMLQASHYPYTIKQRIAGPYGHLSNPDCAACVAQLTEYGLHTLVLAHLSEKSNVPALALQQIQSTIKQNTLPRIVIAPKQCMEQPIIMEG